MDILDRKIQSYAEANSSSEPALLAELNRETHTDFLYPRMLSGHHQGRLLSLISKMLSPDHVLEVGTYTGYSAICLAEGLAEGGMVHSIEVNDENEPVISKYIEKTGMQAKIKLYFGEALSVIPRIDHPLDLVFLDADKENYLNYYNMVFEKVRPGGIILADNTLWSGKVLDENDREKETVGIREFNMEVTKDNRVDNVLLTIRDGLMMIRKK